MRRTIEKKRRDYHRWKNSGLSKLAFCKGSGIRYHTFLKDCRMFGTEPMLGFSQVELPVAVSSAQRIEIHECDGRRIFLPMDTPEILVKLFLRGHARTE